MPRLFTRFLRPSWPFHTRSNPATRAYPNRQVQLGIETLSAGCRGTDPQNRLFELPGQ